MSELKTKTVIFSKNRTVQPKPALRSLREHSNMDDAEIGVIYIAESGMPYPPLTSLFASRSVKQGDCLPEIASAIEVSNLDGFDSAKYTCGLFTFRRVGEPASG